MTKILELYVGNSSNVKTLFLLEMLTDTVAMSLDLYQTFISQSIQKVANLPLDVHTNHLYRKLPPYNLS